MHDARLEVMTLQQQHRGGRKEQRREGRRREGRAGGITYLEHSHDIVEVLDRLRALVDSFRFGVVILDVVRISMRAFVVLQNKLKKVSAGGGVGGCVRGGAAA